METRRDGVRKGELQNRTEEEEKKVEVRLRKGRKVLLSGCLPAFPGELVIDS